jgi:hypothetical protein
VLRSVTPYHQQDNLFFKLLIEEFNCKTFFYILHLHMYSHVTIVRSIVVPPLYTTERERRWHLFILLLLYKLTKLLMTTNHILSIE